MILFYNDWYKYPNAIIHANTSNHSFLRLANLYKVAGVKNHAFLLALLQPELQNVNPFDEELDIETMAKILYEIKHNPWYFFREIARAPALAGADSVAFKANRANIALYWLFFNHITTILIQPRQTGKSFSTDMLMIYLLNYGLVNTHINMLTRSSELRTQNLDRLKRIQEELPDFLNFKSKDDIFNTEEIRLKKLNNSYRGNLSNMSPKLANNVGRGFTTPILHVDEACFVPNIGIALPAALMAGNAAREIARNNGSFYGTILTTTAGKIDDRDGNYIYKLWLSATVWNEKFFDAENEEELNELILKNNSLKTNEAKKALVNITMSYRQLGYSDEWMRERLNETLAEGEDADRDLFNRWTSGSTRSPIPKEYLEIIKENIVDDPLIEFYSPYNYLLHWYIDDYEKNSLIQKGSTFVIGVDTSEGIGRDDIAMVIRDSLSGKVICVTTFNELNLITLADFFVDFMLKYPNSIMIIERRSSAIAIIDYMLQKFTLYNINPFRRLFNMIVQNKEQYDEEFKEIEKLNYYNEKIMSKYKKHIGFATSGTGVTSRSELYSSTLMNMLKYTSHTLYDNKLSTQILSLVIKNNRIDHPEGGNDDLVIASLLSYWLLTNGKNLSFYNINTMLLLKENTTYLNERYNKEEEELYENEMIEKEKEFVNLIEEYKKEKNEFLLHKLEQRIRFIASELVNKYNRSISVEHMLDEIRREKRLSYF